MDLDSPEHLAKSSDRYVNVADTFRLAAESAFGIDVPDQVHGLWQSTLHAVRRMDILLDEGDETAAPERQNLFLVGVDYVTGNTGHFEPENTDLSESLLDLKDKLSMLGEADRLAFATTLKNLLKVNQRIKTAGDTKELAHLTRLEGQLAARLLTIPLVSGHKREQCYWACARWMTRVGRLGNLFDTIVDLRTDFIGGESRVTPTLRNRASLLRYSLGDAKEVLSKVNPPLICALGKSALGTIAGRRAQYKNYL